MSFKGHFANGTVEGTGSAINVELGFTPTYVKLINIDDAGALYPTLEWTSDMADASGILTLSVTDSGATGNKSSDKITADGITPYSGAAATTGKGFTIGANANVNASGETIVYIAFGSE